MELGSTQSPVTINSNKHAGSPAVVMSENVLAHTMQQQILPEPPCSPIPHSSPMVGESPGVPLHHPTPSPGCKRFIGVSSNARNNIYMKTLMNSPYHKSYTPMSATPGYSPVYHTQFQGEVPSPVKGVAASPRNVGNGTPGSHKFVTPKGVVNPFDTGVDDLDRPAYMSPGFFTISSTPASEKKCFRWSIEHIAELHPADINEMPVHQFISKPDRETEERAQKAIEQYFANNLIVPSPWSDPKKSKRKNVLPATPASQGIGYSEGHPIMTELQGSIQKTLPPKQGVQDAACQTALSLPVNFDLQKVLGAYMNQEPANDGNQQEMLSTSSLRRKLFFHGDTSSVAPSPVKGCTGQDIDLEPASPMYSSQHKDVDWDVNTPLKNPAFSSSPIKSAGTPMHRRCSSDPEFLASPELSPIVHGNIQNSGIKKSRSSGMFGEGLNFDISPVTDNAHGHPQHSPISPIPVSGGGKSAHDESQEFRPKFADSPGFSPIRPPKTPIRKILRRSQEESYIQDEGCTSDEEAESVTPVSSYPKLTNSIPTPVDTLSPIQKITTKLSQSDSNITHTAMDFEFAPSTLQNRFNNNNNILTSSLCETRDFSSDFTDDTHIRTNSSNQDTGYQTASLQSTNQESVSLHTNLTNQFGSLPFNVTNQDLGSHNVSQVSANRDKAPPIMNLTKHFTIGGESEGEELMKTEVRRVNKSFDKQILPKQNLFAQNMFTSDESDTEVTPKNVNVKLFSDDSAFRESSMFESELGRSMEVDSQRGDAEDFCPNEKDVLSRARQALALANSLYPKTSVQTGLGTQDIVIERDSTSTENQQKSKLSASEFAFTVLQKAGEDLAKYERMFSGN